MAEKDINHVDVVNTSESMILNQAQAEGLIQVRKLFIERRPLEVNRPYNEERQLRSERDPYEVFYLNISQTAIEFGRYSTVTRFFQVPLVRACINQDAKHENPDGVMIKGAHIHIYKQGYLDKFAYPLSDQGFSDTRIVPFIRQFLKYCNIEELDVNEQQSLADGV